MKSLTIEDVCEGMGWLAKVGANNNAFIKKEKPRYRLVISRELPYWRVFEVHNGSVSIFTCGATSL